MRPPTVTNATWSRSATVDVFFMFSDCAAFRPASPVVSTTEWFLMECLDAKAAPMSKHKDMSHKLDESRPQIQIPFLQSLRGQHFHMASGDQLHRLQDATLLNH